VFYVLDECVIVRKLFARMMLNLFFHFYLILNLLFICCSFVALFDAGIVVIIVGLGLTNYPKLKEYLATRKTKLTIHSIQAT